jgi:hypothetical protein
VQKGMQSMFLTLEVLSLRVSYPFGLPPVEPFRVWII